MLNRRGLCFGLPFTAVLMVGCGSEPSNSDANNVPAEIAKVTFFVDGMMDQFNIL